VVNVRAAFLERAVFLEKAKTGMIEYAPVLLNEKQKSRPPGENATLLGKETE